MRDQITPDRSGHMEELEVEALRNCMGRVIILTEAGGIFSWMVAELGAGVKDGCWVSWAHLPFRGTFHEKRLQAQHSTCRV